MKAVVTVTGKDQKGIIAKVSSFLADKGVNIEDISQTVLGEYFAMIMLVDLSECTVPFDELVQYLKERRLYVNEPVQADQEV